MVRPLAYTCQARIFLRWISAKGLAPVHLTSRDINDFLCFHRARGRKYATLYAGWHRLRRFLRYLAAEKLAPGCLTEEISCRWLDMPGGLPAYRGVLRELFRRTFPMRKYRLTLFEPHLESYLRHLLDQGYSKASVLHVLNHNYRFHGYLVRGKIRSLAQVSPALLEAFIRQTRARFRKRRGRTPSEFHISVLAGCVEKFLVYAFARLGGSFHEVKHDPDSRLLPNELLGRYLDFCRDHRGLKSATQEGHRKEVLRLRSFLEEKGICGLQAVTAADLQAFCLHRSRDMTAQGLQGVLGPVRHFFRYLQLDGRIESDPAINLLPPCRFRADLRPKYLPWDKVEQLLAGINRGGVAGKRDYAILVLLAQHGLRSREAASLRISDVDFDAPSLLLRERKGGRVARLPLSRRAKEALADYLAVRPACMREEIFLTAQAPIHPLGRGLWAIAWRHLEKRFGRSLPGHGSYVLRHSFAKALLDRGARLSDIGTLLGHRALSSTLTYTRVATEDLRQVADNYADFL